MRILEHALDVRVPGERPEAVPIVGVLGPVDRVFTAQDAKRLVELKTGKKDDRVIFSSIWDKSTILRSPTMTPGRRACRHSLGQESSNH